MPNGLRPPSDFAIFTRRTGAGRSRPSRSAAATRRTASHPVALHLGQGHTINPGRPPIPLHALPCLPGERHPSKPGQTAHENDAPGTALRMPIACVGVLARPRHQPPNTGLGTSQQAIARRGRWVGHRDHALTLTSAARVIKAGVLRFWRVVLHADHHYYDPLGLPLRSARFRLGLYERSLLTRLRRRVSPVP